MYLTDRVQITPNEPPVHLVHFDPGCKSSLIGIKIGGSFVEYDINPMRQINLRLYQLIDKLKSVKDTKKRGSSRWRRQNAKLGNIHRKLNTQTRHYLHCIANQILLGHPDVIEFYIGNWDKRATLVDTGISYLDKRISRRVQRNNPLQSLVGYLTHKSALQWKEVERFDERGTTKTCLYYDHVLPTSLHPFVRVFRCPQCGIEIERDVNPVLNNLMSKQFIPVLLAQG